MKLVTTQSDMRVEGGLHVGLLCVRLDTIVKYLQTLTSASETNLSRFLWRSTCGHMLFTQQGHRGEIFASYNTGF